MFLDLRVYTLSSTKPIELFRAAKLPFGIYDSSKASWWRKRTHPTQGGMVQTFNTSVPDYITKDELKGLTNKLAIRGLGWKFKWIEGHINECVVLTMSFDIKIRTNEPQIGWSTLEEAVSELIARHELRIAGVHIVDGDDNRDGAYEFGLPALLEGHNFSTAFRAEIPLLPPAFANLETQQELPQLEGRIHDVLRVLMNDEGEVGLEDVEMVALSDFLLWFRASGFSADHPHLKRVGGELIKRGITPQ